VKTLLTSDTLFQERRHSPKAEVLIEQNVVNRVTVPLCVPSRLVNLVKIFSQLQYEVTELVFVCVSCFAAMFDQFERRNVASMIGWCMSWLSIALLLLLIDRASTEGQNYEGKVIKGNRNALFLVQNGQRLQFPDFYTFTQMGFNMSVIQKIPDPIMNAIPLGAPIRPIAVYRPEDFMYHRVCSDPDRLVRTRSPAHNNV
jgi:hypothetical protein